MESEAPALTSANAILEITDSLHSGRTVHKIGDQYWVDQYDYSTTKQYKLGDRSAFLALRNRIGI